MSRQDWYQFAFAATTTGKFVFPLCLNLGWRRNQNGVVSSLCLNTCILPKGGLQSNLNQFRWLKDLQLFQFVLHCPPTSDFLPPCLNTFQIHIKKDHIWDIFVHISPYPQRIHITNTSASVAFHCSHTEFWKPKSASKDTDDSDSDSQSGEDLTVRCWLPGLSVMMIWGL